VERYTCRTSHWLQLAVSQYSGGGGGGGSGGCR
jgi:hypothetical protein